MRIAEKDHLELLLNVYNLYVYEIADAIGWDRNSLSNFFKGKSQLVTEQMLKNLSNFFNFSINFFIGDDFSYCVKIDNETFKKDIYIDFKDFIVLKFKGIIIDEFKDKKQIIHHYKNEFLYLFENNHISRSFANIELVKNLNSIDPDKMNIGSKFFYVEPYDYDFGSKHIHCDGGRLKKDYKDYKSIIIDIFDIGGEGVSHWCEYNDLKPRIDYLKATNETVKYIAEEFESSINYEIDNDIESLSENPDEADDFDPYNVCREDYFDSQGASKYLYNDYYLELLNIFINSL